MPRPNSPLFSHWIAWAEKIGPTPSGYTSWKNNCGVQVFRSVAGTTGWEVAPRVTGPTAYDVAMASGWLNPNYGEAPVGAFHFWGPRPGHTGQDMNGGGEVVTMATIYKLIWALQTFLGVQSIVGYSAFKYLGWSLNYGGDIPNPAPVDHPPVPPAVPTPTQRQVGWQGVNLRTQPVAAGTAVLVPAGKILDVLGFVTAKAPTIVGGVSSSTWFHTANGYVWAGAMTDLGIHDLRDETPIVVSPVSVPVVPAGPTKLPVPDPHATPARPVSTRPAPSTPSGLLSGLIAAIVAVLTGKR